MGTAMTWGEAIRLTKLLLNDPASQVCAAYLKWPHPLSREGLIAADQYQVARAVGGDKKAKTHAASPLPDKQIERVGGKNNLTPEQVHAILRPGERAHSPLV